MHKEQSKESTLRLPTANNSTMPILPRWWRLLQKCWCPKSVYYWIIFHKVTPLLLLFSLLLLLLIFCLSLQSIASLPPLFLPLAALADGGLFLEWMNQKQSDRNMIYTEICSFFTNEKTIRKICLQVNCLLFYPLLIFNCPFTMCRIPWWCGRSRLSTTAYPL